VSLSKVEFCWKNRRIVLKPPGSTSAHSLHETVIFPRRSSSQIINANDRREYKIVLFYKASTTLLEAKELRKDWPSEIMAASRDVSLSRNLQDFAQAIDDSGCIFSGAFWNGSNVAMRTFVRSGDLRGLGFLRRIVSTLCWPLTRKAWPEHC
jgi:hypothetical protein